jgi:predicted nucleotidyltransferase
LIAEVKGNPSNEDAVLRAIVDRLVEIFQPEPIYLFGSSVRGDARSDSDYDLMIIVPDSAPVESRDPSPAYRSRWRLGVALDLLVWTHSQFDGRLHLRTSLPSTIHREGQVVLCRLIRSVWPMRNCGY